LQARSYRSNQNQICTLGDNDETMRLGERSVRGASSPSKTAENSFLKRFSRIKLSLNIVKTVRHATKLLIEHLLETGQTQSNGNVTFGLRHPPPADKIASRSFPACKKAYAAET
jgi:hypothetical protein